MTDYTKLGEELSVLPTGYGRANEVRKATERNRKIADETLEFMDIMERRTEVFGEGEISEATFKIAEDFMERLKLIIKD